MNKYLIFTSNPDVQPKGMDDVLKFADRAHKFYFAKVKSDSKLANVGRGDYIISSKGNNLYVIEALKTADTKLIESYERKGLKRMNIKDSERVQIVPFASWCKTANGIAASLAKESSRNTSKTSTNMTKKNSIKDLASRLKGMYTPTEVSSDEVRIAMDGTVCVNTDSGWVTIGADGKLRAYCDEYTFGNFPIFAMPKPASQLQANDIIALKNGYAKVISFDAENGVIKAKSYSGSKKTIYTIEDVLFGQSTVKVIVSLAGNAFGSNGAAGGINPMMMLALNGEGGSFKDLLPLMMMSQAQGGGAAAGMNPMMMMALLGGEDGDSSTFKNLMIAQAFAGGANPFGGMFGAAPAAPAAE